jgi:hypothetical protein
MSCSRPGGTLLTEPIRAVALDQELSSAGELAAPEQGA